MEAATTKQADTSLEGVSSFAKSLFLGEIHDELVFPYPKPDEGEQDRIRSLFASLRELAAEPSTRAGSRRTAGSATT